MRSFLRASFVVVSSLSLVAIVAACSDTDRPPPAGAFSYGGGSSSSSSGGEGGLVGEGGSDGAVGDGGVISCIASGTSSDPIQELTLRGAPPAALGGTLVPGTYVLSELSAYDQSPLDGGDGGEETPGSTLSGFTGRGRIVVTANGIAITGARGPTSSPIPADTVTAYTFVVAGTALDTTQVCPTSASGTKKTIPFSAVGTGLAIFPDANHRELYTKQ